MSSSFEGISCKDIPEDVRWAAREIINIDYVLVGKLLAMAAIDNHGTVLNIVYGDQETIDAQATSLGLSPRTEPGGSVVTVQTPSRERLTKMRQNLLLSLDSGMGRIK